MAKMTVKFFVPFILVFVLLFSFTLLNNGTNDKKDNGEKKVHPRNSCPDI